MQILRTARDSRALPSEWLGGDHGGWRDRMLQLALTIYEDNLCGTCGVDVRYCSSAEYGCEVRTRIDRGKAALDKHHEAKKNAAPVPGEMAGLVFYRRSEEAKSRDVVIDLSNPPHDDD